MTPQGWQEHCRKGQRLPLFVRAARNLILTVKLRAAIKLSRTSILTMPLARPQANSLSTSIPAVGFCRLRCPPTPLRATYPPPTDYDIPPVPSLSFWDPETPSSLPPSSPPIPSAASSPVLPTSSSSLRTLPMSPTMTPPCCYLQPEHTELSPHQAGTSKPPVSPRMLLPPMSPNPPASLRSSLPYSPVSSTSPQSPHNSFLSPPQPNLTVTTYFRLASPLLPASPLSVFDRAISPTSPTFLLSRTATPSIDEGDAWGRSSPTFLWPRIPPVVPCIDNSEPTSGSAAEEVEGLERRNSFSGPPMKTNEVDAVDAERKKMKTEFYHFLATKRAAAMNRLPASPSLASSRSRFAKPWKKLLSQGDARKMEPLPSRRIRRRMWGGLVFRA